MAKRTWSKKEHRILAEFYPYVPTKEIAEELGRPISSVYQRAAAYGLSKCVEYLASPDACRLRRGDNIGRVTRFKPGHVPVNKGLRRPGWAPGRMAETQFRRGDKPHTWRPIGTERLTKEGYLQRKMADTGSTVDDYVEVHRLLWEEHHGPIPAGHTVVFRDKDRTNIAIDNLELISRRELMLRNTVHRLPKELADLIQLRGALNRKLRSLSEKQNVGSSQPSL